MAENMEENHNTKEYFQKMLDKGNIEFCPACGCYSAYASQDINMQDGQRLINDDGFKDGGEAYTDDEILTNWPDVYSIGACSCAGWECGNRSCGLSWVEEDSVYNNFGHYSD